MKCELVIRWCTKEDESIFDFFGRGGQFSAPEKQHQSDSKKQHGKSDRYDGSVVISRSSTTRT